MNRTPGIIRYFVRFSGICMILSALMMVVGGVGAYAKEPKKAKADLTTQAASVVDLNAASQKELEALPGVGGATAKKIIANRPYKTIEELSKAGLSAKKIDGLKGLVTVGSVPAPAAATAPVAAAEKVKKASAAVVDLNAASQKELEALPGVGSATAKKIIANRPYRATEELSKAGLSAKKIDGLKGLVTVGAAAASAAPAATPGASAPLSVPAANVPEPAAEKAKKTAAKLAPGQFVNINTASKAELEALPGIGPSKAQAIIEGRPYNAPEDIMKVRGIKQGTFNKIKDSITVR